MRFHYIDWLRNLGILYLFPYHTARIFDFSEPYYVEGHPNHITTSLINISYWFMPLLFLLAGMASCYGLRKRTGGAYVRERVQRLFVPLVTGLILVVPPQAYFALLAHSDIRIGYWEFLGRYFVDWSDLTGYFGTFTPGQLWFIAFLFVISVALAPVMVALNRRGYEARMLRHPLVVLTPFLGLAVLSALPDVSGKNIFLYSGYFFAGYLLATHDGIIEAVAGYRQAYLGVALVGMAAILVEHYTIGWQSGFGLQGMVFSVWHFFVCWVTLLAILGFGRQYLNRPSKVMAYLNEAAFPLFIVHQTWVVLIGFFVLPAVTGTVAQYLLIVIGSLVASVATYDVIRRVGVLRVLFGVKARSVGAGPRHPRDKDAEPVTVGA